MQAVSATTHLNRNMLLDNAKFFLILALVLSHATMVPAQYSDFFAAARSWFAIWMMPGFCFISGFCAKRFAEKPVAAQAQKIFTLFLYYAFAQIIAIVFDGLILGKSVTYGFFTPRSTLWYLVCLIVWHIFLPFLSKLNKCFVMILVMFVALFFAFDTSMETVDIVYRILDYCPFFIGGFYFKEEWLYKFRNVVFKIISGIVFFGTFLLLFFNHGKNPIPHLSSIDNRLDLNGPFSEIALYVGLKAASFLLSAIVCYAFMILIPSGKMCFSLLGKRTLQVYIFHRIPLYIQRTYFADYFHSFWGGILLCLIFIAIQLILSLKPFEYPFLWLAKIKLPLLKSKNGTTSNT